MPFERKFDEGEVLDRAMQAFWAHGYEATSVSDLVEATGLQRGSLYAAYSDKHGLFCAALKHYDRQHRDAFLRQASRGKNARDTILAAFSQASEPEQKGLPAGCLLVNSALEVSPHNEEVQKIVERSLAQVEAFFATKIDEGKKDGTVAAGVDTAQTAGALLGLFLGLRVVVRAKLGPDVARSICSQAGRMLR